MENTKKKAQAFLMVTFSILGIGMVYEGGYLGIGGTEQTHKVTFNTGSNAEIMETMRYADKVVGVHMSLKSIFYDIDGLVSNGDIKKDNYQIWRYTLDKQVDKIPLIDKGLHIKGVPDKYERYHKELIAITDNLFKINGLIVAQGGTYTLTDEIRGLIKENHKKLLAVEDELSELVDSTTKATDEKERRALGGN